MRAEILVPSTSQLHMLSGRRRRSGRDGLKVRAPLAPAVADRVQKAVTAVGFTLASGRIDVGGSLDMKHAPEGADLGVALAALLADPAHQFLRREEVVAWGRLNADGTVHGAGRQLVRDLPTDPWIGRFSWPPTWVANQQPVLSLIDISRLDQAWEAMLRLNEIERVLDIERKALAEQQ